MFFGLVSYRHGRGPILITTNESVRDWTELLAGDEALTTAILDRLLHNAHVINIKGEVTDSETSRAPSRVARVDPNTARGA